MFPFKETDLVTAALEYVKAGFSVIPLHSLKGKNKCSCGKIDCTSIAKHPRTRFGLKDASSDPDQIRKWWKQFPDANIGLLTGKGLVIVDCDFQHGAGDTLQQIRLPMTTSVITGNGYHFYFKTNQPIKNAVGIRPGVDIRGDGGYVVAPPSVHYTGTKYQFDSQSALADFPADLFTQPVAPTSQPDPDDEIIIEDTTLDDQIIQGQRNNYLTSIAGKLRRMGMSESEILASLLQSNRERCQPPLADREVQLIARSVARYQAGQVLEDLQGTFTPNPQTSQQSGSTLTGVMTLDDLLLTLFTDEEPILTGFYPSEWGLVTAVSNLGKSTLMLNICLSLACGKPFAPFTPHNQRPRRVLYVDLESNARRLQKDLYHMRQSLTWAEQQLTDQNLHFALEPEVNGQPFFLNERSSAAALARYLKQHKIELVVVDTLAQAVSLNDENNNSEVQKKVVIPVRRLAHYTECAFLLIHHEGKGNASDGEVYEMFRARGASALPSAARYVISMRPEQENSREMVRVSCAKDKGERFHPVTLKINQSRWFEYASVAKTPDLDQVIYDFIKSKGQVRTGEIVSAISPRWSDRSIKLALNRLHMASEITRTRHGLYEIAAASDQSDTQNGP